MSGVRRFLSRREKSPHPLHHHKEQKLTKPSKQPDHFGGVFAAKHDPQHKPDKEEEKKIKGILERLRAYGFEHMVESNVEYALHSQSSQGDPEAAFKLLMLLQNTYEGIIESYNPSTRFLGAINRGSVSCYLDSLLFAMFARLDSFEAMLYNNFEDAKRKRLAGLIRLWVNMLRSGRLITTDITEHLQNAMADCGWTEAAQLKQQDPSEAFTFITGQLELPMLTLKMDMYHTGKEDPQDDHKFVNERLLEVAILDEPPEGHDVLTLEDCLEHYFNNRIEIKRLQESRRRNTLKSAQSIDANQDATKMEKESGMHIEVLEVPETPGASTPVVSTPLAETPMQFKSPAEMLMRPATGRKRQDSIFSQRKIEIVGVDPERVNTNDTDATQDAKGRKLSTRTEVLMPAWQFFKLLPWYTDNMPTSDAQVAAHFSKKRPVLGICLKRYSYTNAGQARRLNTYVDIPLEIAVPNFVSDDNMHEEGPLVGNFRLLLQSVVCHRGVSVNSGHYICLCRGKAGTKPRPANSEERRESDDSGDEVEDPWMRFDDLAKERINYVDIRQALKDETPYLLFYQVQPIGDDGHSIHELPSYTEATSRHESDAAPLEKPYLHEPFGSQNTLDQANSAPTAIDRPSTDWTSASARTSLEVHPRGRSAAADEARRKSIALDSSSLASYSGSTRTDPTSNSVASTPSEEKGNTLLSVAHQVSSSRRGSRTGTLSKVQSHSRSRPTSTDPSNRFSLNMSKLTQKLSRNGDSQEGPVPAAPSSEHVEQVGDEKEVESAPLPPSQPGNVVSLPHTTNTSKESVNIAKPQPKLRKDKKHKGAAKHESKEERDCVIM